MSERPKQPAWKVAYFVMIAVIIGLFAVLILAGVAVFGAF
jgi:hypothetical protein